MIFSPITVLVVEDEGMLCDLISDELNEVGFSVIRAATGGEALEVIESEKPVDVLFTDIRLPGSLDGWDLAERFRAKNPRGPVIYATGYSEAARRQVAQSAFLSKPYRPSAIIGEIRRLSGPA